MSASASFTATRRSYPPPGGPESSDRELGVPGFRYKDLHAPERLRDLYAVFCAELEKSAPDAWKTYEAYRACKGEGMGPEAVSEALLAVAPHVSAFVGRLFGVDKELASLSGEIRTRSPLWKFRAEFVKKRVVKDSAGKAWTGTLAEAAAVATAAVSAMFPLESHAVLRRGTRELPDEELSVAKAVVALHEVDDTARRAAKAGGASWTDELRARAVSVRKALSDDWRVTKIAEHACACEDASAPTDAENGRVVAFALDAIEAWLASRRKDHGDPAHTWATLRQPHNLDPQNLVRLVRPEAKLPELFVGPQDERRERDGFVLTDRRMSPRHVEQEIDYCLYCHERDKDSCSKGYRDPKTKEIKKNALGVLLNGCPLDEKISEMHVMRRDGDPLAALALVTLDNPMCPGTGHRICNDCMKACVFQKQDPVNIPEIETRVLTEVLGLPFGLEIYGLLTRWNPLDVRRPFPAPYCGKNVLVVGLGPAGYTLAHHLTREGFGVVAVDGLKVEPLPASLVGDADTPPAPVRDFGALYEELDERTLLGFGGVSEYGITVRWDKNFLTVLYITLARNPLLRMYGGVRFGGTLTLDDAWQLGFDHVALAAGAGRPTIIPMKNNLARGIRKASDFLMALQLTGAYKRSSIANLQVSLPAIVIGGGLTAIDTATELLAYYPVQLEKTARRIDALTKERGPEAVRAMFDDEEWAQLEVQLQQARELEEERELAAREARDPRLQPLLDKWGGVTLVYRRSLVESPAYRLNHEEVAKSLEEGVRYVENLSPLEAVLDGKGHVKAVKFQRGDRSVVELPARTVCVAAGTSPNTMYEKEYEGSFALDDKKQYFRAHGASRAGDAIALDPATRSDQAFFTSYQRDGRTVSFYGDNHPYYAGSVVKAMASAKHGFPHVAALFPEVKAWDAPSDAAREGELQARARDFFAKTDDLLLAHVVKVNRLTRTIVEVVVRAPLAARKFKPGQFYRLQNFESYSPVVDGTRMAMEGLALTGAWIDEEKGLLGTIVLEMGGSSRLCAALREGEPAILMGPTGTPTEIMAGETVLLCGGGLGNAVLFSIARAFKGMGSKVLYFAGYKNGEDLFKQDDIEKYTDLVVWCTDAGAEVPVRRAQDAHFRGNIVQAMIAYGKGELAARKDGKPPIPLSQVGRIIAIGSDRMMAAVKDARHGALAPLLDPKHLAIGSINSPMQCMMKEVCAQCLQRQRDPETGKELLVFTCFNQDQPLDWVDFGHLRERLRANSMQEKITNAWLDQMIEHAPDLTRV
ncbi:MAG: FAD-dependent oxidoreductase [Myxococcales bacterium]|nr:FAD-dependent oxidoreductase [Myxococcales bacterium]